MYSLLILVLFWLVQPLVFGFDWPTYGGPQNNHCSKESSLRVDWGDEEPEILWKHEVGLGYSSVVEVNGLAYTQGYEDQQNTLFCVDASKGEILWKFSYPSGLGDKYFQGGSRSTPTVAQGRIYLQGHEGPLFCLDALSGKLIWETHLVEKLGGRSPTWGYSGAPLFSKDKIIVQTGAMDGSLVALDSRNGQEIWRGGKAEAGYASPYLRKSEPGQIVVFNQTGLSLHALSDGAEKITYQHRTRYDVNAAQPLDLGDRLLVASGYGKGAVMLSLQSAQPKVLWESDEVACQMASLVPLNGHAFGVHGQTGAKADRATLFCLDLKAGRKVWEERGYGVGTVILVDKTLVVLSDRGELSLIDGSTKGFSEFAQFQVLGGKNNWIPPTYVNGRMYCRSSSGRWVCLAMGKK
jgi:outer membrane protein assembly factor BamB